MPVAIGNHASQIVQCGIMKYFHCDITDYNNDEDESNDVFSADGTLDEILQDFFDLPEEDGSFLGLENEQGQVIQFMWEGDNNWLVDIPVMEKEGSFQKHADYDGCVDFIEQFFNGGTIDISEFTFEPFGDDDGDDDQTVHAEEEKDEKEEQDNSAAIMSKYGFVPEKGKKYGIP